MGTLENGSTKTAATAMGSVQSSQNAPFSHYCSRSSMEESFNRAQLAETRQTSDNRGVIDTSMVPQQHRESADMLHNPKRVITALQTNLTAREEDFNKYKTKYDKLKDIHRQSQQAAEEQEKQLTHYREEHEWQQALLHSILTKYIQPYAEKNGFSPNHWYPEHLHATLEYMFQDASEAGFLHEQIRVLQKELLSKADKVQAVSDDQFAMDFRVIMSLVKSLSRTIRLIDTADTVAALRKGVLIEGVSTQHWSNRARKKCLVEAWVWSVLINLVFRSPFSIFGEQFDILGAVWPNMFSKDHVNDWPTPSTLCETWRYTTMEQMMSLIDQAAVTQGKVKGATRIIEHGTLAARKRVVNEIQTGLAQTSTSIDTAQVQNIIDKAFTLAMQMSLQPYRLQVTYPKAGVAFNKEEMAAIPDSEDEDINEGVVAFIVNPGLTKWGDTHGKHFDQRYDIVPSLVHVEVPVCDQEVFKQERLQAFAEIKTSDR